MTAKELRTGTLSAGRKASYGETADGYSEIGCICELSGFIISQYQDVYPELGENRNFILEELRKESDLFARTLEEGLRKAKRYLDRIESGRDRVLDGELAFRLYDTYGFPIEFTVELAKERGSTWTWKDSDRNHSALCSHRKSGMDAHFLIR